jgi:hypothetical protein
MRRLGIGLAALMVALGVSAPPAQAADVGVVTATAPSVGALVCNAAPFAMHLEFTGTLAAAGQTYVGTFATDVAGTYRNGPCTVNGPRHLRATLSTPGSVTGSSLAGSVAGTCGGSESDTFEAFPAAGGLLLVEPHDRGVLHLGCQVSVNGGALTAINVDANLVGLVSVNLFQAGVYNTR